MAEEQSGKGGGGGGREGDHMCCAKSTVNGAFTREQLSTCMRTKVTVEMYVYVE